jgi:hypothetical protein
MAGMTRCPKCGAENPDEVLYCWACSALLKRFSAPGEAPQGQRLNETSHEGLMSSRTRMPIAMLVLAIVVGLAGIALYAVAWASALNEIGEFGNDPFNPDFGDLNRAVALTITAYVLWALAGILFIAGLILLVIRSI